VTDLSDFDAVGQAELVQRGELTALELVEAAIARIEQLDQQIGAVAIPVFERGRRDAASPDLPDGGLRGVPTLVKDSVPTAGDPWHRGMRLLRQLDFHATFEAHIVTRMRAAGMVIVGKANVPELEGAITTEPVVYGPTRNPWNLEYSAGGSSGGPAAAVAAGLVPVALGVDGGGSIRIPSGLCGVVGLKPSRGRTSLFPLFTEEGLSTANLITRSVRDCALGLDLVSGTPPGDHFVGPRRERPFSEEVGVDPGPLRIGVWSPGVAGITAHTDCVRAAEHAGNLLESLGHKVEFAHPAELDVDLLHTPEFNQQVTSYLAYVLQSIEEDIGRRITVDDIEPVTAAALAAGTQVPATVLHRAMAHTRAAAARYADWWTSGFDLLVTPTIAVSPYRLGVVSPPAPGQPWPDLGAWIPFTAHANFAGMPAISLPLWWNEAGLPVGTQFVAEYGREDLLVRVAAQVEAAQPWWNRRPAVHASPARP
jgi:amidase